MKQEEINKGNRLIAEFIQLKFIVREKDTWINTSTSDYGAQSGHTERQGKWYYGQMIKDKVHESDLKYHSSWDWLMPVVEKINSICSKHGQELSNHSKDQQHLPNQLDNPLHWKSWSYHNVSLSTNIERVWLAVTEFIKWHNSHNPQA